MCKYWGELMGMSNGGVRLPLFDLSDAEKLELQEKYDNLLADIEEDGETSN